MAEKRPGQILNSRPLHVYPTRHRVRQLGVDTIEEYDNILDHLFSNNNATMAVTPDDIAKLGKRLGSHVGPSGAVWRKSKRQRFF